MPTDPWRIFEEDVAQAFGLRLTIASGNKHFDPGDAVTPGRDHPFPLYADAKFTERKSFSLKLADLSNYVDIALGMGKRFILPLRFHPKGANRPCDFVVLGLEDFQELYERAVR